MPRESNRSDIVRASPATNSPDTANQGRGPDWQAEAPRGVRQSWARYEAEYCPDLGRSGCASVRRRVRQSGGAIHGAETQDVSDLFLNDGCNLVITVVSQDIIASL